MPPGDPKKVVIIGAGASGVFTAYLLDKQAPGEFDIKILEQNERVGGHTQRVVETLPPFDPVSIDYGAQFFSESAQEDYCDLLREEGLFDVPGLIKKVDMGISIWNQTLSDLHFRIPSTLYEFAYAPTGSVSQWLCFIWMTLHAKILFELGDWNITFKTWIDALKFPFVSAADEAAFKKNVVRPLMYQFGLVTPDEMDILSAKFVVWYFLTSFPKELTATPFSAYNSLEGLDGILKRLLEIRGLTGNVVVDQTVQSIAKTDAGWKVVAKNKLSVETEHPADEIIFATNPMQALAVLPDTADYADVRAVLGDLRFDNVRVRIQRGIPNYMPDSLTEWSASNVIIADDDAIEPGDSHYMLSIWFGPLRDELLGAFFFKCWGSPTLHPLVAPYHAEHWHQLMVGTPLFIQRRDELREDYQGIDSIWYVGAHMIDYASQNAALRSARDTVGRMLSKYGIAPILPGFLMRPFEFEAAGRGERVLVDHTLPETFPLLDLIEKSILTFRADDPVVDKWKDARAELDRMGSGRGPGPSSS